MTWPNQQASPQKKKGEKEKGEKERAVGKVVERESAREQVRRDAKAELFACLLLLCLCVEVGFFCNGHFCAHSVCV